MCREGKNYTQIVGLSKISRVVLISLALIGTIVYVNSNTFAGFDYPGKGGNEFNGEPLTPAEKTLIEDALKKLESPVPTPSPVEEDLNKVAKCVRDILNAGRICRETGTATTTNLGATHGKDSRRSHVCTDDNINISADLLDAPGRYDGEAADVMLAVTLAHEGRHARSRSTSERNAFTKEIEATNFLLGRVTDQKAKEALEELKADRERRLRALSRRDGGPGPMDFLAAAGSVDTPDLLCKFSISSEEPSSLFVSTFQTDPISSRREPISFVERPLAVIQTQFGGQQLVLVSGTALNDSVGRVELLQLGSPPGCLIQGASQLIFELEGSRPTSLAADESTGNVYVLDDRFKRIFVVEPDRSVLEVANSSRFPELADMVSINFAPSPNEPPLTSTSLAWFWDSFHPADLRFLLKDTNGDLVIDAVITQRLRDVITFAPFFAADPMVGEIQALVRGTPRSTIVLVDAGGATLGSTIILIEGPAIMSLARPLILGEQVTLLDQTVSLLGQSKEVSPLQPFILAPNPDFGSVEGGELLELIGKNFASDSRVFFEGIEAGVQSVEPTRIVVVTPPSPFPALPLEPAFVTVEVQSSQAAPAFTDFTYLDPADLVFERDDTDNDRIPDIIDNCPTVANPGQKDSNLNEVGDVCELGEIINDFVAFNPIKSTFKTTSDISGCPPGFVGKFSFDARLTNKNTSPPLSDLMVRVRKLTNRNLLQNADGGAGGEGATLRVPEEVGFSDGVLEPEETVDVTFVICLKEKKKFSFFVDVLGIVEEVE